MLLCATSSYTHVTSITPANISNFYANDTAFGRRVVTLGGGLCGMTGVRAPVAPSGQCNLIVSAAGGSRGGALYAISLSGSTFSTIISSSIKQIWPSSLATTDNLGRAVFFVFLGPFRARKFSSASPHFPLHPSFLCMQAGGWSTLAMSVVCREDLRPLTLLQSSCHLAYPC